MGDVTADILIALVDEGCQLMESNAELDIEVPNLHGAERPITDEGFRDGRARIEMTTSGLHVTVKVYATAKAGITRRPVTATVYSEFSGEGAQRTLTETVKEAMVEAVPVLVEREDPESPVTEEEVTAEEPTADKTVADEDVTEETPAIPVTPPTFEQVFDTDKMRCFNAPPIFPEDGGIPVSESRERWADR